MNKKIVFIGGEVGIGKTSAAHYLRQDNHECSVVLDKDDMTSVFTNNMLAKLGQKEYDRESSIYLDFIRDIEYKQLDQIALSLAEQGEFDTIYVTAPYFVLFENSVFLREQLLKYGMVGYDVRFVFLEAFKPYYILDRLRLRNEDRDRWKMSNWQVYRSGINKYISSIKNTGGVSIVYVEKSDTIEDIAQKIYQEI